VLIFFTATKVVRPDGTHVALSFGAAGGFRVLCCFLGRGHPVGDTGFIGMSLAVGAT
jgi:hypothetical protein